MGGVSELRDLTWIIWQLGHMATLSLLQYRPIFNPVLCFPKMLKEKRWQWNRQLTFTIVLLCLIKVWKPSHLIFIESSKTTTINANSSRVAWTCYNTAKLQPALLITNSSTSEATLLPFLFQEARGFDNSLSTAVWHAGNPKATLKANTALFFIFSIFTALCFLLKPVEFSSIRYQPEFPGNPRPFWTWITSKKCIAVFETKGQDTSNSSKNLLEKFETAIFFSEMQEEKLLEQREFT